MNETEQNARDNNATLLERGKTYGPYPDGLKIREDILLSIKAGYRAHHGNEMSIRHESYFWDIANKLGRLAVTPDYIDGWHDIAGYSQLIEATVKESKNEK
jgi:hypothetical protein